MKKFLSILFVVAILTAVFVFAGCGDKKENVNPTEAPVEAVTEVPAETEAPKVPQTTKQELYEGLLKDTSKIDLVSNNTLINSSGAGVSTEVTISSNGDVKLSMKLAENAYYIAYAIGNETYMEMHVPEFITTDREGYEITVPAEVLYYKTTGMDSYNPTIMSPISNAEDVLKDFKSVKYVETKEVNGTKCDVVEAVKEIAVSNEGETGGTNNDSKNNGSHQVTYNLYFTETDNKFYGCSVKDDEVTTTLYCVDKVDVELPKQDFKKADGLTIEDKISNMLTGASQEGTSIDPTE